MATKAHCAYCFESISASFDRRQPQSLQEIQELWKQYVDDEGEEVVDGDQDGEVNDDSTLAQPAAISRLSNKPATSKSSNSSLPSVKSSSSSSRTGTATPASSVSSRSSPFALGRSSKPAPESHPLFVTWNTTRSGHRSLRGCIGTFKAQEIQEGLRHYARVAAFEDERFSPIPSSALPSLQCCVTLLTNFSAPTRDPMDWTLGKHGIRLSFVHNGVAYGATYLPDVAKEQGWTKEETIVSLMRKAGWRGKKDEWSRVQNLEIVRYEGKKVDLDYDEWKAFKDWSTS